MCHFLLQNKKNGWWVKVLLFSHLTTVKNRGTRPRSRKDITCPVHYLSHYIIIYEYSIGYEAEFPDDERCVFVFLCFSRFTPLYSYKPMDFSVKAFAKHNLCRWKITNVFMCLKSALFPVLRRPNGWFSSEKPETQISQKNFEKKVYHI